MDIFPSACKGKERLSKLSHKTLIVLLSSVETYLCQTEFSAVPVMKKPRSRLIAEKELWEASS
jgi:hypothetical protein